MKNRKIPLFIILLLSIAYLIFSYLYIFYFSFIYSDYIRAAVFFIPIFALIDIIGSIISIHRKKDIKRNQIILIALILVFLCSIGNYYCTVHGFTTVGLQSVEKIEEDGDYFLILDSPSNNTLKMECDETTYHNVIADDNVQYSVEYSWNSLKPNTGHLVSIDLDDYCDNRK